MVILAEICDQSQWFGSHQGFGERMGNADLLPRVLGVLEVLLHLAHLASLFKHAPFAC